MTQKIKDEYLLNLYKELYPIGSLWKDWFGDKYCLWKVKDFCQKSITYQHLYINNEYIETNESVIACIMVSMENNQSFEFILPLNFERHKAT